MPPWSGRRAERVSPRPSRGPLVGTFGTETVQVPRARIQDADGRTTDWRSRALPRYQRLTRTAEALITAVYLSGTDTRRSEAEKAIFRWTIAPPNAGAAGAVQGRGEQGRREPRVAQDQGGLGRMVRP